MDYENIKHNAEHKTRKWNTIFLIITILLFTIIGLIGLPHLSDKSDISIFMGVMFVIIAVVGIVSVKLLCSLTDTITNISVKLDMLEDMQRTLKKIESNQNRLTRHLDE